MAYLFTHFIGEQPQGEQIYFSYEGEHYWIYEAGLGVQDYLKNHLVN